MRCLSHPHVVRLFEVIETTSEIYMVMEYVNSGELFYYLTEKGRLQEDEARYFFQQVRVITYVNKKSSFRFSCISGCQVTWLFVYNYSVQETNDVACTNNVKNFFCNAGIDNFRY